MRQASFNSLRRSPKRRKALALMPLVFHFLHQRRNRTRRRRAENASRRRKSSTPLLLCPGAEPSTRRCAAPFRRTSPAVRGSNSRPSLVRKSRKLLAASQTPTRREAFAPVAPRRASEFDDRRYRRRSKTRRRLANLKASVMLKARKETPAEHRRQTRRGVAPRNPYAPVQFAAIGPFHRHAMGGVLRRQADRARGQRRANAVEPNQTDAGDAHATHQLRAKGRRQQLGEHVGIDAIVNEYSAVDRSADGG